MTKNEIDNIRKSFDEWNKDKNNKLPKFLLYSRAFLSFTKEKERIKYFLKNNNNNCYRIVFILKNNKGIDNKYSSNADIENLSVIEIEKEVLFFPYTTFCLKNIFEGEYDNQHCFYIELDYLGKYEYIFDEFKAYENFQNDIINSIFFYSNSYGNEVIKRGLIPFNSNLKIIIEKIKENNSDDLKVTKVDNKEEKFKEISLKTNGFSVENKTCSYNYLKKKNKIPKKELVSFKSFNLYGKNKKNLRKRKIRYKSVNKIQPQHTIKKNIAENNLNKFLNKKENMNKEFISINFTFSTGEKYKIQCSPYITVNELISYFLETLNSKLSIDELKKEIEFLYQGENLNKFNSKTIKEMKIDDSTAILVVDNNKVIFHEQSIYEFLSA